MLSQLRLDNYFLEKFSIEYLYPGPDQDEPEYEHDVDYEVLVNPEDHTNFIVTLSVAVKPLNDVGLAISAKISGIYKFNGDEQDADKFAHTNGTTILYGILRGLIGGISGTFPGMKYTLPSINMLEVVKKKQEQNREKARKAINSETLTE